MATQRILLAKGKQLLELGYRRGDRWYAVREGQDGVFGRRRVEKRKSANAAVDAANHEIEAHTKKGFREIDPRRLRSNVPGARYVSWPTLAPILAAAKAPKGWHKRVAHARYLLEDGALLHDGDLRIDRLEVGPNPLVVRGDLVVRGVLSDHRKADETCLIVLGDLDAGSCATFSSMSIAGDARIRGVLYGFSAHDHVLSVGGALSARTLIDGDHWFESHRSSDIGLVVGARGCLLGKARARRTAAPHEALRKPAWEWVEPGASGVKHYAVGRLVKAGKNPMA